MTASSIDPATGNLTVAGTAVFPLGLSDPPPATSTAPSGLEAWAEVAGAGVNYVRNYTVWTAAIIPGPWGAGGWTPYGSVPPARIELAHAV